MNKRKIDTELFQETYLSAVQILAKLADPTFLFGEIGRGSGKTTHILAPRIDRVQNSMPGATLMFAGATYKSLIDNIIPQASSYFIENYERGYYYEIGKQPPKHFKKCDTLITDWKHTYSFHTGAVLKLASCDRPESMLGVNTPHIFLDEMRKIKKEKFVQNMLPALRADRSKYGHSPYFMGMTGFSSTPNFEVDEDWWTEYESNMLPELMDSIIEIAYEIDMRKYELRKAQKSFNPDLVKQCENFIRRWTERVNELRRGQTYYLRASSFSNIKILGIDYIENQLKSIKDDDDFNTEILGIRKNKVKDRFFGKFGKEHIFEDSYIYDRIDKMSIEENIKFTSRDLKHCATNEPLYMGFDPGPFMSCVFGQRNHSAKEFRVIKDFCVIHPEQHEELAEKIDDFFKEHRYKKIFLHYDRAANQRDPKYRDYYALTGDLSDTDANLLKIYLERKGWQVELMSLGMPVIYYSQHYHLLNILFGKNDGTRDKILIDGNECESLVSSIYHSPLKRHEGKVMLDKSSEKLLEYKDQRLYSTQISSAAMYLFFGEYKKYLPASDNPGALEYGGGTYTA